MPRTTAGLRQRGSSWEAFVYDRRTKQKIRKTFNGEGSYAAAKAWRHDAASALRKGALRPSNSTTLARAWEAWLEAAKRGEILSRHRRPYKPATLRTYEHDVDEYVLDDLGALKLSDVRPDDLQALVDRLVGAGLSGSKVRNVLVPLQALYRRHRREIAFDPTDDLDLPEPGGRRDRVVSPVQAERLLAALPATERALWATAFYAGLRRGELRALRVSDLEPEAISVARGWDDVEGEIAPKSTAGVRRVPLTATLRTILADHLERTARHGEELLFGRAPRAPFTPGHVQDSADEAWGAAAVGAFVRGLGGELERVTLHECRHSFSTYLDAAGISETRADRYMGHANPSVANRYRHQLEGQLAEDAARLDAYLVGATAGRVVQLQTGAGTGADEAQTRLAARAS